MYFQEGSHCFRLEELVFVWFRLSVVSDSRVQIGGHLLLVPSYAGLQILRSVSVGLGLRAASLLRMYPPLFPATDPTGRRWVLNRGHLYQGLIRPHAPVTGTLTPADKKFGMQLQGRAL